MSTPGVVVALGTDHHPFTRVVQWVDAWAARHEDVDVFVQHGTAAPPRVARGAALVTHAELLDLFAGAGAVVTHGGPGTITDARQSGRQPIVVPRDPRRGEHVDDHQQLFTARMAAAGQIVRVDDEASLVAAIDRALADPDAFACSVDDQPVRAAVERVASLIERLEAGGLTRRSLRLRPLGEDELPDPSSG